LPVTGDPLSFETFKQFQSDLTVLDSHPVWLPLLQVFIDMWNDGYVSAKGTWTIKGDEIATPEQTSEIVCRKATSTCIEAKLFPEFT
jgi:hypothetical protein